MYAAGGIFAAASFLLCFMMFPFVTAIELWICIMLGLGGGMAIGKATEYFTSFDFGPVISIKDRGITGPATVVIQGLGVGMISCVPTVLVFLLAY